MTARSHILVAAAVTCLLISAALKGMRYTPDAHANETNPTLEITSFLAPFGWQPAPADPGRTNTAYTVHSYRSGACPNPLHVVIAGQHDGLVPLLRMEYGNNLAFIQNGQVVTKPNLLRYHFASAVRNVSLLAGFSGAPVAPIIAVSPAPTNKAVQCMAPSAADWRGLRPR